MSMLGSQPQSVLPQQYDEGDYGSFQDSYQPPPMMNPMYGAQTINQDQSFMKQTFNFRKEVIDPLLHTWRGHEYDFEHECWVVPKQGCYPIMNEEGIRYCISFIQSYINAVFTVSNFDERNMHIIMRYSMKNLIHNLCKRYKDFNLNKLDITRIFWEIHSKQLAILLGARGDGYRQFWSKQYHVSENINNMPMQQNRPGILSGISSIFKKSAGGGQ